MRFLQEPSEEGFFIFMTEIVSSTGGAGLARRSYSRWYLNRVDGVVANPVEVSGFLDSMGRNKWWRKGRRDVFRGLATEGVVKGLLANLQTRSDVEVAFPVQENVWYLNAARRYGRRNSLVPVDVMCKQIAESNPNRIDREAVVASVLAEGHTFLTGLPSDRATQCQLLDLWGKTFGWTGKKIRSLASQLAEEQRQELPSIWFSAIRNKNGRLTAAAMAERIVFPTENGDLHIVESTEWRSTEQDHMKAVV